LFLWTIDSKSCFHVEKGGPQICFWCQKIMWIEIYEGHGLIRDHCYEIIPEDNVTQKLYFQ